MRVAVEWIPTPDVQIGDKIVCLLSDACAYPRVTGWTDDALDRDRYSQKGTTYRRFTVDGAPWWATDMTSFDLADRTLIVSRDEPQGHEANEPGAPAEPPFEQLHAWMREGMAEALDGCEVELDGTCPHGKPSWLLSLGLI